MPPLESGSREGGTSPGRRVNIISYLVRRRPPVSSCVPTPSAHAWQPLAVSRPAAPTWVDVVSSASGAGAMARTLPGAATAALCKQRLLPLQQLSRARSTALARNRVISLGPPVAVSSIVDMSRKENGGGDGGTRRPGREAEASIAAARATPLWWVRAVGGCCRNARPSDPPTCRLPKDE